MKPVVRISLLLFVISSLVIGQGEASCVKLSQCEHLDWMMRNKHNIPGVTSSEVAQHLNSLNCGFQGGEPKVNCNNVEDPAPVDVAVTQTAVATRSRSRTRARGGFSRNLNVQSSSCRGSLLAYYLPATRQGSRLGSFRKTRFRGRSYGNLQRFVRGTVVGLQNNGNCCWSAHSRLGFNGARQVLRNGVNSRPSFQPKSLRQMTNC